MDKEDDFKAILHANIYGNYCSITLSSFILAMQFWQGISAFLTEFAEKTQKTTLWGVSAFLRHFCADEAYIARFRV